MWRRASASSLKGPPWPVRLARPIGLRPARFLRHADPAPALFNGTGCRAASSAVASAVPPSYRAPVSDDPLDLIEAEPKHLLPDGESMSFPSSRNPSLIYTVERHNGKVWCDCPAWMYQKNVPQSQKSCKHLREVFGMAWETERVARELGVDPAEVNLVEREKACRKRGSKKPIAGSTEEDALGKLAAKLRKAQKKKSQPSTEPPSPSTSASRPSDMATEPTLEAVAIKPRKSSASKGKAKATSIDFEPIPSLPSAPALLLAKKYDLALNKPDPSAWWLSEKLDGVRLFWDGKGGLWSRMGKPFYAPSWWKASLPVGVQLDGEAWMGRGHFSKTAGIVKSHSSQEWHKVRFQAFDIPNEATKPFEERMERLKTLFPQAGERPAVDDGTQDRLAKEGDVVDLVEQVECKDREHLLQMLEVVQKLGGEGLMMRKPGSLYEGKRSSTLLKVKTFSDAEAVVIEHLPGTGKYSKLIGALRCRSADGVEFRIGSGMDDEERDPGNGRAPGVGQVVTYRYQEVSKDGVPRFPTYVGIAVDKPVP